MFEGSKLRYSPSNDVDVGRCSRLVELGGGVFGKAECGTIVKFITVVIQTWPLKRCRRTELFDFKREGIFGEAEEIRRKKLPW